MEKQFSFSGGAPQEQRPIIRRWTWNWVLLAIAWAVVLPVGGRAAQAQANDQVPGRWHYQDQFQEIVAEFKSDGSFQQVTKTAVGAQEFQGRYGLRGGVLRIEPEGNLAQDIQCQFPDPDTMRLTYPGGQTILARRLKPAVKSSDIPPTTKPAQEAPAVAQAPSAAASGPRRPARLLMNRVEEPNEKAFTVLVPQGWKTAGGIFNVNPLERNGPGNSISPKCDFSVQRDASGSIMVRWLPSWNYADLSRSPMGYGLFQPGQQYQGMLVRPLVGPRQFLTELLLKEHPGAQDLRIVAEDALTEVSTAFAKQAERLNQSLQQLGLEPMRFESLALLVEYTQAGQRYRESVRTTIADNRSGAFQWSNDSTLLFRAPAAEFESWKPILDSIQASLKVSPQWMAAVLRAGGERAKAALETQQYLNKVANEIVENRRKTNAEIRHEQWLLISGQEEYKNPFTGEVERDTSAYRYRWESNQGGVILSDENSFDPNRYEEYNTREWKRSEIWDRKN